MELGSRYGHDSLCHAFVLVIMLHTDNIIYLSLENVFFCILSIGGCYVNSGKSNNQIQAY